MLQAGRAKYTRPTLRRSALPRSIRVKPVIRRLLPASNANPHARIRSVTHIDPGIARMAA